MGQADNTQTPPISFNITKRETQILHASQCNAIKVHGTLTKKNTKDSIEKRKKKHYYQL